MATACAKTLIDACCGQVATIARHKGDEISSESAGPGPDSFPWMQTALEKTPGCTVHNLASAAKSESATTSWCVCAHT